MRSIWLEPGVTAAPPAPGIVTYLGPARVTACDGSRVQVEAGASTWRARLALPGFYRPEPGDEVLVVVSDEAFVIGVLAGHGRTVLDVPGDLELRAGRRVQLRGRDGVSIEGREVRIGARRLAVTVDELVERAARCARWVRGLFELRAGRVRAAADADWNVRAASIDERATGDVKIDGEKIRLG